MRALLLAAVVLLAGCDGGPEFDYFTLALSWQPAFCERNADKPECRTLDSDDAAAQAPTLHGLWPSDAGGDHPAYCGVDGTLRARDEAGDWCDLPETGVAGATRSALRGAMPGTASCLDRHEWLKHGTCSGLDGESYFRTATRLTQEFAFTRLAALLRARIGKQVSTAALIDAFTAEFGADAGRALIVVCRTFRGQTYLAEIRIALRPDALDRPLGPDSLFSGAAAQARPCPKSLRVDRAGPG